MTATKDGTLELQVWFALRDLEVRFRHLLRRVPTDETRPELWTRYTEERAKLADGIKRLRASLVAALGEEPNFEESQAGRAFAVLLIHYDERELVKVDVRGQEHGMTLLQTEHCGLYDGGERFFRFLEDALRSPATPPLVMQLFLFCLRSGFCGRYPSQEHPELREHFNELRRRVVVEGVTESVELPASPALERIRGRGFPYSYYLGAFGALICIWLFLTLRAKAHETYRLGPQACELN